MKSGDSKEPPAAGKPTRLPKLPSLLERKIYKTGQTRGADDDVIFQNRVGRNSTVLIPYAFFEQALRPDGFENGYIVLISPLEYFEQKDIEKDLQSKGLKIGTNALIFYETRAQWDAHNPEKINWNPAEKRTDPLGGQYVVRVPATTSLQNGAKIVRGFTATSGKGAGIRVYEYADSPTIKDCRDQLEALFWLCHDADTVVIAAGMASGDVAFRKKAVLEDCTKRGLLDYEKLANARVISSKNKKTTCPLCLEEISAAGFMARLEQAKGRVVPDLTVTQINLFHIEELRINTYNHRPYNLGWGHHHCNVVVKDSGINETLAWMEAVIERNSKEGLFKRGEQS